MIVLTVDQQQSRRTGDRVDALLARLAARRADLALPFERTAGDEVQAVVDDPAVVVDLVLALVRDASWSVGVGVGAVTQPLPDSTRAGSGPAFSNARAAVTRAKSRPTSLAVVGPDPVNAGHAEAALGLLAAMVAGRSGPGWEAVDLARSGLPQREIAVRLGVSKQAVSQRLAAAHWSLEGPGRQVSAHLLMVADGTVDR